MVEALKSGVLAGGGWTKDHVAEMTGMAKVSSATLPYHFSVLRDHTNVCVRTFPVDCLQQAVSFSSLLNTRGAGLRAGSNSCWPKSLVADAVPPRKATGFELDDIMMANLFYEFGTFCTSIVAEDEDGYCSPQSCCLS